MYVEIYVTMHIYNVQYTYKYNDVSVKSFRNNCNMNIINPHVHLLGDDAAAIAYIRITQFIDK